MPVACLVSRAGLPETMTPYAQETVTMKLIISELNALARYVSREFHYVMQELIERYGWRHLETQELFKGAQPLKARLRELLGELPDIMLFWEGYEVLPERAKDLLELPCHKIIFADDLHWWNEQIRYRKVISYLLCDTILATYADAFAQFYPDIAIKRPVVWVPHSACADFLLAFNSDAENAIFLSGAINDYYPLRQQLKRLYDAQGYPIVYQPHPGYHCAYDYRRDKNVGRGYAEKINRRRAGFTDGLRFSYLVAKHFEIPATGALLLADEAVSVSFKRLGFIENLHYLPVSSGNLEAVIRYVIDEKNHQELDEIRQRGQALVWARHQTADRARLIDEACQATATSRHANSQFAID
jgi:glycosyl transferase family 1